MASLLCQVGIVLLFWGMALVALVGIAPVGPLPLRLRLRLPLPALAPAIESAQSVARGKGFSQYSRLAKTFRFASSLSASGFEEERVPYRSSIVEQSGDLLCMTMVSERYALLPVVALLWTRESR
jgi:hypothetical protein